MDEYLRRLLKCVDRGLLPREALTVAEVSHDEDCGFQRGVGGCDCDPWIRVDCGGGSLWVTADRFLTSESPDD